MPKARKHGLVVQELPDELLVYDTDRNHALCLNKTAWRVMEACDGETTVEDAALLVSGKLQANIDDNFLWAAIEKLAKKDLLEAGSVPANLPKLGRRDLIRTAGALAVALPLVTTIVAPSAVSAQSAGGGACVTFGMDCCSTNDCCGNGAVCIGNLCQPGQPPPSPAAICCASNSGGFMPGQDFNSGVFPTQNCSPAATLCCSGNISVTPGTTCTPDSGGGGFNCSCRCGPFPT